MGLEGASPDGGLAQSRILAELESIFQSAEFERAPVMRRLLAFLVRTTLAGQGDDLKAYAVAVDGLGRDPDFDSHSDSYPRVQVGRLRKMLDVYYAQMPPSDGVRLFIKPGGYRVQFTATEGDATIRLQPALDKAARTEAVQTSEVPAEPGARQGRAGALPGRSLLLGLGAMLLLAVITAAAWSLYPRNETVQHATPVMEIRRISPVGGPDANPLARRAEALLGVALHRSWLVRVTTPETSAPATAASPEYRLTGQVNAGPGYNGRRLFLTLWDLKAGSQIWSDVVVLPDDDTPLPDVMRPVVSTLIQPFGVIATDQRAKRGDNDRSTYGCLLDYDRYFRDRDSALRPRIKACVAAALKREPRNATVLAAASFLAYDFSIGGGTPAAHARGAELARQAVEADPYSADAQLADARAAFVAGHCRRGKEIANRTVTLNPYNPDNLGLLGFLMYMCDDPAAAALLNTARSLDSEIPPFYTVAQMLALIEQGKSDEAIRIAETIRAPGAGMSAQYELVRTIALATRGDKIGARRHWRQIVERRTVSSAAPDRILQQYFYSPLFRAKVVRFLDQHGVTNTAPARPG